jgi:hypothetical protein
LGVLISPSAETAAVPIDFGSVLAASRRMGTASSFRAAERLDHLLLQGGSFFS